MACQIHVRRVQIGLVAVGLGHTTAQVVRNQQFTGAAKEGEGAHVRADPVGELLRPGGLGVGVVGGAQHGHEDLSGTDLAGTPIHDLDALSGVVYEQLLTGAVLLAHHHVELRRPGAVLVAEPAVLVTLGIGDLVLVP